MSVLEALTAGRQLPPTYGQSFAPMDGSGGSGWALAPGTAPALSGTAPSFTYTPGGAVDQSVVDYIKANPQARVGGAFQSANGYTFAPILTPRSASLTNGDQGSDYAGFGVNDNKPWYQGQNEYKYDADGKYLGFNPIEDPRKVSWVDRWGPFIPLLVVGGAAAAGAGAGAGAGVAATGSAEAGSAAVAGGVSEAGAVGGAGGFIGEGVASGIPAWDAAAAAAPTWTAPAVGSGVFKASVDSQLASEQLGITGSQAAADAASAAIPSVSLVGDAAPSLLDAAKGIFDTVTSNSIGKALVQAGVSSVLGRLLGSAGGGSRQASVTAPALPPPTPIPSPIASYREQQDSVLQQLSRRGRASTILTKRAGT